MSKSDTNLNNIISLLDDPTIIKKKISRAVTDSGNEIKFDDKKPGLSNLINIYSALSGLSHKNIENEFIGKMYSDFKLKLIDLIISSLEPIQKKYNDIISDKNYINDILEDGRQKASYKARRTLSKVYRKVGFIIPK